MSDPFERLREGRRPSGSPDLDAIRARAARLAFRRRAGVGATAATLALVVAIGVLVVREPEEATPTLAQAQPTATVESVQTPEPTPLRSRASASVKAPDPTPPPPDEGTSSEPATSGPATDEAGELEATLDVREAGPRRAEFTLTVCNRADHAVSRQFGDAQRYDFEVMWGRKVVWRWSHDRMFAQVLGEHSWGPGECESWTEIWDGTHSSGAPAEPGSYEAAGILDMSPPLRTQERSFCLDVC